MAKAKSTKTEGTPEGEKPKRGPGRPEKYTVELGDLICTLIADGQSLRAICNDERMPDRETVRKWLIGDAEFSAKYARARVDQAGHHEDEIDDIERQVLAGTLKPDAARVVLDSKRWRMEKLAPKVYGQRLNVAGVENAPIQIVRKTYAGE